jgi:hypothetical protein
MTPLRIGGALIALFVWIGGCSGGDDGGQSSACAACSQDGGQGGEASRDEGPGGICRPDCSSATCLEPGDRCGGLCPGVCQSREKGCKVDVVCPPGFSCLASADGTTTCLPGTCAFRVLVPPLCGSPDAACGDDCPQCTPRCEGLECGPDPNCGQSCGTCTGGKYCSGVGKCVQPTCDPPIMVPDGDGGLRPIMELDGSFNSCPG